MTSPRLDMAPWIGQRQASFRFELFDGPTGMSRGLITPLRDSAPTLTHDTSRTVKRTLSLEFGRDDAERVNPIRDRITITMLIGGQEYPLGRYMFLDYTRARFSSGLLTTTSMSDEMFIVDQEMDRGFSARQTVDQSIQTLLHPLVSAGLIKTDIEASGLQATGSWTAGTSRAKVLEDLAIQGGYFSPWMDNNGVLRMIRAFDPADKLPDFDLDEGSRVIQGSIAETDDLLSAPNMFVVISNGSEGDGANVPVVGTYTVPNSAPHSIVNRGFTIPSVQDIQLTSQNQAQVAARAIGLSATVYERAELDTVPDPRHDSYNVIRWQEELWLELDWSMTLAEGGEMRHTLRKAYS